MSTVRWNEIAESLRHLITEGQLQPGDRLPSEKVLAAQWGVCRMTAHRAMSELERDGFVFRKRRVGTIVVPRPGSATIAPEDIDEKEPLDDAISPGFPTVSKDTKRIALLGFHINDFPQSDYFQGFRTHLPDNYHVLMCDTENRSEREGEFLRRLANEADAFCLYPTCNADNSPLLAAIAQSGTPVICMDRIPRGVEDTVDGMVTDNYSATRESLQMLRTRGHQYIALLTTENPSVSSLRERRHAWRDFLTETGVGDADRQALLRRFPPGLGYDFSLLGQFVHDALYTMRYAAPHPPTAVLCVDDFFLAAAMEACDRMGLSIPHDFELLSFSDYPPLAARLAQNSHRIGQQPREMGRLSAERLILRLSGRYTDAPNTVRVPALLSIAGRDTVIPLSNMGNSYSQQE